MAQQRIDPFYIDINLTSSIDLQANVTDYVDLIKKFIDESVANNMYWHTDSHSDPITSKIEFFKNLNNSTLPVKTTKNGAVKTTTTAAELINKN